MYKTLFTIFSNLKSFGDQIKALMKTEDIMKSTSCRWLYSPICSAQNYTLSDEPATQRRAACLQIYKLDLSRRKIKRRGRERKAGRPGGGRGRRGNWSSSRSLSRALLFDMLKLWNNFAVNWFSTLMFLL